VNQSAEQTLPTFLRMPMVVRMTGLGRSTIYRLIAEKKFASPVRLGDRAVAWRRADLDLWSDDRPKTASPSDESCQTSLPRHRG
jgi:prophage regulatory protein